MKITHLLKRRNRTGAAFMLIIVMVLLVVLAATQTLVRGELSSRRWEKTRLKERSLVAAIEAGRVATATDPSLDRLVLPVLSSEEERIEVTIENDGALIVARWLRGGQLIDQMTQNANTILETQE